MKKKNVLFRFIAFLFVLVSSTTAFADTTISSGEFSITLPGMWLQGGNWHKRIGSSDELLFMLSDPFDVNEDELADYPFTDLDLLEKNYKKKDEFKSLEVQPLQFKGINTGLLISHFEGNIKSYTIPYWCDGRGCFICFRCPEEANYELTELLEMAEKVQSSQSTKNESSGTEKKNTLSYVKFGDAEIVPTRYKLKKRGNDTLLFIYFKWHNLSDTPSRFATTFSVTAFQNGIELKTGFDFSEETNTGTQIMKNIELECTEIFVLRDTTNQVSFTVDRLLDFQNQYDDVSYTITLSK